MNPTSAYRSVNAVGTMRKFTLVQLGNHQLNIEGNYYAVGNVCTHVGGPLVSRFLKYKIRNIYIH